MRHILLVIFLSFHVENTFSNPTTGESDPLQKLTSQSLFNKPGNRSVRCSPCDQGPTGFGSGRGRQLGPERGRQLIPDHMNPEYRGNGADNLGYDWSPKAWGGLAYPHKSRALMNMMRGRDGRQMMMWNQNTGNVRVICDTCRTYWDGSSGGGEYDGTSGRQFPSGGGGQGPQGPQGPPGFFGGQPGPWNRDRTGPQEYEERVRSATVGVLVKPGSRIAYIPSVSGDMIWDGVSGGGTRWDGFSNGISWVGNTSPDWDNDAASRELKPGNYPSGPNGPGRYNSNHIPYRPWDNQKGISTWDSSGKGYYFANGYPNQIDSQWRDRGYASNWQYGSTNQNGWNGNKMKWTYSSKNWDDSDRSFNRFYFNSPEDRSYGPGGGIQQQYGNQYPNYQPWSGGYRGGSQGSSSVYSGIYRATQGVRVNDRDPANFSPQGNRDRRPWDYNSVNRFGDRRPTLRPDWRPDPNYTGSYDKDGPGKYPTTTKYPVTHKHDEDKSWTGRPGYGPTKPDSEGGYPFGGNRFPGSDDNTRPTPGGGGTLFIPNDGSEGQPQYPSSSSRPGGQPSSGNHAGYPAGSGGSSPNGGNPSVVYIGSRPSGPGSGGHYPGGNTGGYSGGEGSGVYPTAGGSGGYPMGGDSGGYPSTSGGYPTGGGSYPSGNRRPGYGFSGNRPGGTYSGQGGGYGGYPNDGPSPGGGYSGSNFYGGYPESNNRPGYSGGSSYPGDKPGYYGGEGSRYPGGGYPSGYGDRYPGRYPDWGGRPTGYPSGGGQTSYPSSGNSGYPGAGGSFPVGGGGYRPKGYYTGIITELGPDNRPYGPGSQTNYFGSGYSGGNKNRYPNGGANANNYPSDGKNRFNEERYSGGNGGGDRFYFYGQDLNKGQNGDGYSNGSGGGGDQNHGSSHDKNNWNYGENKDGIYRRSGGSYPPYRGGQYYTSSFLAPASTTSQGSEAKTPSMTKPDDVTQPTPES